MHALINPHTAPTPLFEGQREALNSGALVSLTAAAPHACEGLFVVPVVCSSRLWQAFAQAPQLDQAIRETLALFHLYARRRPEADAVPFVAVIPGSGSLRHPLLGLFGQDEAGQSVVSLLYADEA